MQFVGSLIFVIAGLLCIGSALIDFWYQSVGTQLPLKSFKVKFFIFNVYIRSIFSLISPDRQTCVRNRSKYDRNIIDVPGWNRRFRRFRLNVNGRTDIWTDGHMDGRTYGRTDRRSYRDAHMTQCKIWWKNCFSTHTDQLTDLWCLIHASYHTRYLS